MLGLEPRILRLEVSCVIQLRYTDILLNLITLKNYNINNLFIKIVNQSIG